MVLGDVPLPMFYTYILIDPRTKEPFYVGKGKGRRMYQHESGNKHNKYVRERITDIKSTGLKIIYEKWFESDDEDFCFWMENYLIDYFGLENICNIRLGGNGVQWGFSTPEERSKRAGWKDITPEQRERRLSGIIWKNLTTEQKESRRKSLLGNESSKGNSPNSGSFKKGRVSNTKGKRFPGNTNAGSFKKGHISIPWNKGIKGYSNAGSFKIGCKGGPGNGRKPMPYEKIQNIIRLHEQGLRCNGNSVKSGC